MPDLTSLLQTDIAIATMLTTELVKDLFVVRFKLFTSQYIPLVSVVFGVVFGLAKDGLNGDAALHGLLTGFAVTYGIKWVDSRLKKLSS